MPLRVVIIDERNGPLRKDASNADVPEDAVEGILNMVKNTDIGISITADGVFVRKGEELGLVALVQTKTEAELSAEKAAAQGEQPIYKEQTEESREDARNKATAVWKDDDVKTAFSEDD